MRCNSCPQLPKISPISRAWGDQQVPGLGFWTSSESLCELIRKDRDRQLILLIEPPGCGKTASISELAEQARASVMNLSLQLGNRLANLLRFNANSRLAIACAKSPRTTPTVEPACGRWRRHCAAVDRPQARSYEPATPWM